MAGKRMRTFLFILYTWFVYNAYIFICAPIIIYVFGWEDYVEFVLTAFFLLPIMELLLADPMGIFYLIGIVLFLLMINGLQLVFWCKKQTLKSASVLTLSNMILVESGIIFIGGNLRDFAPIGLLMMAFTVAFYYLLNLTNIDLEKRYADNEIYKKARHFLTAPCLNTK